MSRVIHLLGVLALGVCIPTVSLAGEEATWWDDYARAMEQAKRDGLMLLIVFHDVDDDSLLSRIEATALESEAIVAELSRYVCVKLPLDATIRSGGKELKVMRHSAFEKLHGEPGVAILDFASKDAPYYGCVVSALSLNEESDLSARHMEIVLKLPSGTPEYRQTLYRHRSETNVVAADYVTTDEQEGATILTDATHSTSGVLPVDPFGTNSDAPVAEIEWLADYAEAVREAQKRDRMLLIRFYDTGDKNELCRRLDSESLSDVTVREKLREFVCARLPLHAKAMIDGRQITILKHRAFDEMLDSPGVAILDFTDEKAATYGRVISTFPVAGKLWYSPKQMRIILDLPPGTLTQRTLIYAVRIHPERPASSNGQIDQYLLEAAESHSRHQARIRLQGHHQWETRFHRIAAKLPMELTPTEVCAESWPGERLVEAAIECVRCWRFSEGHWSAVRPYHPIYGYDMKRGSNGIWYATGIFGKK